MILSVCCLGIVIILLVIIIAELVLHYDNYKRHKDTNLKKICRYYSNDFDDIH